MDEFELTSYVEDFVGNEDLDAGIRTIEIGLHAINCDLANLINSYHKSDIGLVLAAMRIFIDSLLAACPEPVEIVYHAIVKSYLGITIRYDNPKDNHPEVKIMEKEWSKEGDHGNQTDI